MPPAFIHWSPGASPDAGLWEGTEWGPGGPPSTSSGQSHAPVQGGCWSPRAPDTGARSGSPGSLGERPAVSQAQMAGAALRLTQGRGQAGQWAGGLDSLMYLGQRSRSDRWGTLARWKGHPWPASWPPQGTNLAQKTTVPLTVLILDMGRGRGGGVASGRKGRRVGSGPGWEQPGQGRAGAGGARNPPATGAARCPQGEDGAGGGVAGLSHRHTCPGPRVCGLLPTARTGTTGEEEPSIRQHPVSPRRGGGAAAL